MPGEQDAGFFEQLARGRDVIRDRLRGWKPLELLDRVRDSVAPRFVGVAVAILDPAAGKHVRAAHERRAFMSPHHEDFRPGRAVAQHDDRRGRTGVCDDGVAGWDSHRGQY